MRGLQNMIYHHSYIFSFLLFFVALLVLPEISISVNTLSSTESLTISSNRTIVSPGGVFELGFFEIDSNSRWYLGIWYKNEDLREYVWVANRDNPISNSIGVLRISDGNLVLLDHSNTLVWSTNRPRDTRSSPVGELLDNGNFVLREFDNIKGEDGFLWQSFDFPTNTLLPQMKLGLDRKTGITKILRSWKSRNDPSSGNFTYELNIRGLPEFFSNIRETRLHRSGPWDGTRFIGIQDKPVSYMVYNFTDNKEEVAYSFTMLNKSIYSRLSLNPVGGLERYVVIPPSLQWNLIWTSPKDDCDAYLECGPYGYCDVNTAPVCNCIKGFEPKKPQAWWNLSFWQAGCVRRTRLNCRDDGFVPLKKIKLPVTENVIVDKKISTKECRERCLGDCNCTAFANTDIRNGGSGCVIWTGELMDIRNYAVDGQDLYVRLAASDLDKINPGEERNNRRKIIGSIIGASIMFLLSLTIFYFWKRKHKLASGISGPTVYGDNNQDVAIISGENNTEDFKLPLIEFKAVVIATDNFSESNKLGQGGFGTVYKGRLSDGQEIAVKRLSKMSSQGIIEFKNEVKLIAKLQHLNLVRLLAWCVDADENMLIYEYLENLSLDFYLFDETQSSKLDWQMRFDIINGIARGLLYLHQDSRLKIIHRDLKASNILLDKDMTPKISDFGMARIFGRYETEAYTRKVVGTYGYMSPEYAMDGIYSTKSDVFSFGVLLLEIISGKRNKGFYNSDRDLNLLACVWRNWNEGNGLEVVDPIIIDSSTSFAPTTFRPKEIIRCINIGLLCVQEHAHDRPTMSSVVWMLGSETTAIPQPEPPGYCIGRKPPGNDYSLSVDNESWTLNQITLSVVNGR